MFLFKFLEVVGPFFSGPKSSNYINIEAINDLGVSKGNEYGFLIFFMTRLRRIK